MTSPAQADEQRQPPSLLLQEGACGPGTAACSNRLLLGFLDVLYEGVEFGFEGGGIGGGVSCFGTHAEQGRRRSGPRTTVMAQRLATVWTVGLKP
jgi:hypothetical protein